MRSRAGMAKKNICVLLDVPVRHDQHLSSLVCSKCITRIKSLEMAGKDLASFKRSVSSLKRTMATTGEVGCHITHSGRGLARRLQGHFLQVTKITKQVCKLMQ